MEEETHELTLSTEQPPGQETHRPGEMEAWALVHLLDQEVQLRQDKGRPIAHYVQGGIPSTHRFALGEEGAFSPALQAKTAWVPQGEQVAPSQDRAQCTAALGPTGELPGSVQRVDTGTKAFCKRHKGAP